MTYIIYEKFSKIPKSFNISSTVLWQLHFTLSMDPDTQEMNADLQHCVLESTTHGNVKTDFPFPFAANKRKLPFSVSSVFRCLDD
jgi:hypothetical protein